MGSPLAGRYITSTDDFLAVTDEKSLIEATDDPRGPETDLESFDELEAAATADPDSDEAAVLAQIIDVIDRVVGSVEPIIEAFGATRYAIPFAPVDPTVKSLAVRWAWIDLQERRGTITTDDAERKRDSLRAIGDRISDGRIVLQSALTVEEVTGDDVFAHGGATRRFSQAIFDGQSANYRSGR